MMIDTVFMDRDGVINQDSPDYIKSPDEFTFIKGSCDAIARLSKLGKKIIIITNQSAVGRQFMSHSILSDIFEKLTKGVEDKGGKLDDIVYCPHHPDDHCLCRKPLPGMIIQSAEKHSLDLSRSCMIGDSVKDIECGLSAGVRYLILVKTGNGLMSEKLLKEKNIKPDYFADDLDAAARWIVSKDD